MNTIETRVSNSIIQKPVRVKLSKKEYCFYPFTLGKLHVLTQYEDVYATILECKDSFEMLYTICDEYKDDVCKIISICSFNDRWNLTNDIKIANRANLFGKADSETLASILTIIFGMEDIESYIEYLGLDIEQRDKKAIQEARTDNRDKSFGGRSVYGAVIDTVCTRYGWTLDYVLWDISFFNIQMIIQDTITNISLSEEEHNSISLPSEYADNPENADKILSNFSHLAE